MTKRGQKTALEELRKQYPDGWWNFQETIFEIRLGREQLSEDDRLSYMAEHLQKAARSRAEYDPSCLSGQEEIPK